MLKNNIICDIIDVHGMKNIVTKPTCFKSETLTLIDVVITTVPKRFKHVCCIESVLKLLSSILKKNSAFCLKTSYFMNKQEPHRWQLFQWSRLAHNRLQSFSISLFLAKN